MKNKIYGLNFENIPRGAIPYNEPLENCDILENKDKTAIMYMEEGDGFRIITNDPTVHLTASAINTVWTKL